MKNTILSILLIASSFLSAQSDSSFNSSLAHELTLNQYLFNFSSNGGSEISYRLNYKLKRKLSLSARTGLFYQSPYLNNLRSNNKIGYSSNSYIPFFIGTGLTFGKNNILIASLELGLPLFWLSRYSKSIRTGIGESYWVDASAVVYEYRTFGERILLMPQVQCTYFLKNGIGFQFGFAGLLTRTLNGSVTSSELKYVSGLSFNISGKLGLSYRF